MRIALIGVDSAADAVANRELASKEKTNLVFDLLPIVVPPFNRDLESIKINLSPFFFT